MNDAETEKKLLRKDLQILRLKLKLKDAEIELKEKEQKIMRNNDGWVTLILGAVAIILAIYLVLG